MKILPYTEHFFRGFVLLGLLVIASNCTDDKETPFPVSAQFTQLALSFAENEGEHIIDLRLSNPAVADGQIVLNASAYTTSCFVTEPATELGQIKIPVQKGRALFQFKISPVDNNVLDGCKVIKFSLGSLPPGVGKGDVREMIISVNDDEAPVDAGFEINTMSVRENEPSGAKFDITFAAPAPADGVLLLKFQSVSRYGVDYATEPAAVSDKIFLQVSKGATSATVGIYPVNDQSFKADRNISFQIQDATGGLKVGGKDSFWFTITEDDGHQISAISAIRSMFVQEPIILKDSYIEGIVTSMSNVSAGRVVIEDATGGLPLQLPANHNLTRGDLVLVNLDNGTLHLLQGVLEVGQVATFEKLGEEGFRVNKLTLEELVQSPSGVQSQTVQISGASFSQADGNITLLGDRALSDGTRSIIVRTSDFADFGDELVPNGLVNVTGIFVNVDGQNFLYPQDLKDIKKQQFMLKRD